ncbi:eukaryotic translation initiation factor 3 subunit D, partial [Entophlyctis helioformis]
ARRGAPAGRFADRRELRTREASIKVGNAWTVVEEFDFGRLNKLFYEYEDPQDIAVHGSVQYVDRTYERVSAKNERPLVPVEKTLSNVTASEDPVIQDMARDAEGPTVFATDLVLAALMSATRSVYSFDIVVTKKDDKLFLDKRDGSALDFVTVNENAADPPVEGLEKETNINSPQALAFEASHINRTFAQQILRDSERVEFANSNPFAHGEAVEAVASAAYRYRRWDLGTVKLVARTQLDAAVQHAGAGAQADEYPADIQSSTFPEKDTVFAIVRSLNEFDSRAAGSGGAPDWRQKLDVQRGAVVATELKNNANKLARWTLEGVLSGASQIRLGFVSRASPRDRKRHVILGMTTLKPYDFAAQINVNIGAGWGVVKAFIDFCYGNLQNGKYVLLRDPNKPVLRLYHVAAALARGDLDNDDEDDEDDDEDEDDDDD